MLEVFRELLDNMAMSQIKDSFITLRIGSCRYEIDISHMSGIPVKRIPIKHSTL